MGAALPALLIPVFWSGNLIAHLLRCIMFYWQRRGPGSAIKETDPH
jgi:hypothetical protein